MCIAWKTGNPLWINYTKYTVTLNNFDRRVSFVIYSKHEETNKENPKQTEPCFRCKFRPCQGSNQNVAPWSDSIIITIKTRCVTCAFLPQGQTTSEFLRKKAELRDVVHRFLKVEEHVVVEVICYSHLFETLGKIWVEEGVRVKVMFLTRNFE